MIGSSNDATNFSCNLVPIHGQVSKFCQAFANNISANTKLSKSQLS